MTTIKYEFVASGAEDVERAFDGIDKRAEESAKANTSARAKITAALKASVATQERIERAHAAKVQQIARQAERSQTRSAEQQAQRHRALLREQISLGEQAGKAQARQNATMRRLRERFDASESKAHERRIAAAKRAGERQGRETGTAMAKSMSSTQGASFGGILKEMFSGNAIRSAIGRLGSVAKGVGLSALGTSAALFTGVTASASRGAMRTQEVANRVSINSRMAGRIAADPDVLRKEFESAAVSNPGQTAAAIGEAVQAYVTKTGDLAGGRRFAGTFATVASATGANVSDIANASADIAQKFDITGITEMQEALAALTYQGKSGAFELADAATKLAKMGSAASAFGFNKGLSGLKTLGGLSQIVQSSTGDADVTATATSAMLRQFVGQSGKIKRLTGVDVFKDKGRTKTRDIQDLIVETIGGAKGDLTKMQDIFGDEGGQAMKPFISTFNQAGAKLGPKATEKERVAAGMTAVRGQLNAAINAPGDYSQVQQDAAQAQQDTSAKLTAAWEKITVVVGEKLLPVIAEFAERIADTPELIDAFRDALGTIVQMMTSLGLIRKKTVEQVAESAAGKAKSLGKRREELLADLGAAASPEMRADQVKELAAVSVEEAASQKEADRASALVQAKKDIQTPEALAERMISIGTVGKTPEEEALRRRDLTQQANRIFADPSANIDDGKRIIAGQGEESENQFALRQEVAKAQQVKQSTPSASGVSGEGISALAASLKAAAEAFRTNSGNQPSTVAATP